MFIHLFIFSLPACVLFIEGASHSFIRFHDNGSTKSHTILYYRKGTIVATDEMTIQNVEKYTLRMNLVFPK